MIKPGFLRQRTARTIVLAVVLAAAALATAGCNNYYTPPPPVAVRLASPVTSLVIVTTDSFGNRVPAAVPMQVQVLNAANANVTYSVGQYGNYVAGGTAALGTITGNGVYQAPAVVPDPNTITIQAVSQQDPTRSATVTIDLLNPAATVASVTPDVVTAGESYTLDIKGSQFEPGASIELGGAQLKNVQQVSSTEMTATAQIAAPGLLSLKVVNPSAVTGSGSFAMRSQPSSPAGSSAVAVLIANAGTDQQGNPIVATKAYVPKGNTLAVVNADTGKEIHSVPMPNGFTATAAAADPAHDQVVVADAASNILQVVNADTDIVTRSIVVAPVTGTTTVNGASCAICGLVVDSARSRAILDTAVGYLSVDLTTGAASAPLAAPAAANFAYDAQTQRIYAPYFNGSSTGVNLIDLVKHTVTPALLSNGVLYGNAPVAAAFDFGTGVLTVSDGNSSQYLNLNFNNATVSAGSVETPANTFSVTSGCPGVWNGLMLDAANHLGWFANQGGCVAVGAMPGAPPAGAPGPPRTLRWAQVPLGPDGLAWANTPPGQPLSLAVYSGPDGDTYGLAVNKSTTELLKVDLSELLQATLVSGGADANQVDPTQYRDLNGVITSTVSFIQLR